MTGFIAMYEVREKGFKVYRILFDKPNVLSLSLTRRGGFLWIYKSRRYYIIMRHSKPDINMTLDVLEGEKLPIEQKERIIL